MILQLAHNNILVTPIKYSVQMQKIDILFIWIKQFIKELELFVLNTST